jgi:hypothetical protein
VTDKKLDLEDERVRIWESLLLSDGKVFADYKLMVLENPFI